MKSLKKRVDKTDKRQFIAPRLAKKLENTQIDKYHWKNSGVGFSAEDSNSLNDEFNFKKVKRVGVSNVSNGPDRFTNNIPIQTKYHNNPHSTIKSAFDIKTGIYKYNGQLLEVPNDQYVKCVELMKKKIVEGKVPGITDPQFAIDIIKKGNVNFKQASNIAKAGNIDSIKYDFKNNLVTSTHAFGLSFAIEFAQRKLNGEKTFDCIKNSIVCGLKSGSSSIISGILSSQILRTRFAAQSTILMKTGIKKLANTQVGKSAIEKIAMTSLSKGVSGAAAINHVSKLLRSNVITASITTVVIAAPDAYRALISKSISWTQFGKNFTVNAVGVASGTGGWFAGAAIGAAIGSTIPIVGTVAGGVIGGFLGSLGIGMAGSKVTKIAMDRFIEDDAVKMINIVENVVSIVANDYLLTKSEVKKLVKEIRKIITSKWLKDMFKANASSNSSSGSKKFAKQAIETICKKIVSKREKVKIPKNKLVKNVINKMKLVPNFA